MADELKLLRGCDYVINDKISIRQPTLGEISEYGEKDYFSIVTNFCLIPSDVKSTLADVGIDYEKIADFELFIQLRHGFDSERTAILFGENIDFSKMGVFHNTQTEENILCEIDHANNPIENGLIIDSYIYELIVSHVRKMHGFQKKVEKAHNEYTKRVLIEEDRQARKKKQEYKSLLKSLIVSMVCCSDFPYSYSDVWSVPISAFMESITQVQKKTNVGYLIQGIYSGGIDGTKINKDELKWI